MPAFAGLLKDCEAEVRAAAAEKLKVLVLIQCNCFFRSVGNSNCF